MPHVGLCSLSLCERLLTLARRLSLLALPADFSIPSFSAAPVGAAQNSDGGAKCSCESKWDGTWCTEGEHAFIYPSRPSSCNSHSFPYFCSHRMTSASVLMTWACCPLARDADRDECAAGGNPCSNDGVCENKLPADGGYKCHCKPGYEGDNCDVGVCCWEATGCGARHVSCCRVHALRAATA